jgi:hypothetical protein
MNFEEIVLRQIGDREGRDQAPVEQPHEGIPDINLSRREVIAASIKHAKV